MAVAVADTLDAGDTLVCEAGTGVGKTFAYLVPALLSGRKVLVSTGTRNLQDQLFHRDLPLVREVLGVGVRIALLKGRANYLCPYRLGTALADEGRRDPTPEVPTAAGARLGRRRPRAETSQSCPSQTMPRCGPSSPPPPTTAWGRTAPSGIACPLLAARRRAQAADLVVVNHHLLCADLALKDQGFGEVLPGADCFIIDEAHQLPEVASSFFGTALSSRALLDLIRDLEVEYQREAADVPELPAARRGPAPCGAGSASGPRRRESARPLAGDSGEPRAPCGPGRSDHSARCPGVGPHRHQGPRQGARCLSGQVQRRGRATGRGDRG